MGPGIGIETNMLMYTVYIDRIKDEWKAQATLQFHHRKQKRSFNIKYSFKCFINQKSRTNAPRK